MNKSNESKPTGHLIVNVFCYNCNVPFWMERLDKVYINLDAFQEISCPNCGSTSWRLDVKIETQDSIFLAK